MTRDQLEHAIRAACDVAKDTELLIFGSQAILGEHPTAPPDLRTSIEVDVQPVNNPAAVDAIDGNLGERFLEGLIDDQVLLERVRTLPVDQDDRDRLETWESRTTEDF